MTGGAGHNRIVISHTRFLRRLRYVVDVGAKRNHWLARAPCRHPASRHAGHVVFDLESVSFENPHQIFRRLELLIAQLGVTEDLIDHLLGGLPHALDVANHVGFETVEPRICRRLSGTTPRLTFLKRANTQSRTRPGNEAGGQYQRTRNNQKPDLPCVRHSSSPSISSSPTSTTTL